MAEPISFVASIVTLAATLNTASTGIQKLITLRHASDRLLDVHNKLEELKTLIPIAKRAAESSSIDDGNAVFRFERLLTRANAAVEEASKLIHEKLTKNPESLDQDGVKTNVKKRRFLRDEDKLQSISARLSDIIQSFQSALCAVSANELHTIRATLTSVHFHVTEPRYIDQRINTRIQELMPPPKPIYNPAKSPPMDVGQTISIAAVEDLKTSGSSVGDASLSAIALPSSPLPTNMKVDSSSSGRHVKVELTVEQDVIASFCSCSCHWSVAMKTPNWLANAVGMLLLRWQRSPQTCKRPSCRNCSKATRKTMRIQYYLPWWMMGRIVQLESGYNASRRLTISFKTSHIVPEDSNVFLLAQHNNLDGIKKLFSQGLASPFDVSPTGRTPLHFAATAVRGEMIDFLTKQHAETDLEDQDSLSPQDIIWELFLRKPEKRRHLLTAAGLSPEHTDSLEKQCFTGVHRVVLGIGGVFPLDDYLKVNCSEIDDRDLTGKTALAWAASRHDHVPVGILLRHGASLRIADNRSKTPLHYAAGSGAPESVELILQAIKKLEQDGTTLDPSLIEAGDDKARTPLNYATRMDLYPHTKLLLKYGASLDARESKTKRCILLNSIYWNSHTVIPLLLSRGAKTDYRDSNGATLLHHIARFGDLETLRLLSQLKIGHIDPNIKDAKGLTAVDAFNSSNARCSPEEGETREIAVQLFGRILGNATSGTAHGTPLLMDLDYAHTVEEVDTEDDTFVGAEDYGTRDDSEEANVEAEEHNPIEDDADEIFYDAVSELQINDT